MRFLLLLLLAAPCAAEEIPLSEVWGYRMPDMKEVLSRHHDRSTPGVQSSEAKIIAAELTNPPEAGSPPPRVFLVPGEGKEALNNLVATWNGTDVQSSSVSSAVFYAYEQGVYTHLKSVSVNGNTLELEYVFIPHMDTELTYHFALVPLGKHSGKIKQVAVKTLPLAKQYVDYGYKPDSIKPYINRVSQSAEFP